MSVHLDSEREVEMFFASPLFHALVYTDEREAAGFRLVQPSLTPRLPSEQK